MLFLAKKLSEEGIDVHLLTLEKASFFPETQEVLRKELESTNVTLHQGFFRFQYSSLKKIFTLFLSWFKLIYTAFRYRPVILHSFLPHSNFMSGVAGMIVRPRGVITDWRCLSEYRQLKKIFYLLNRISYLCSTSIVANSHAVLRDLGSGHRLEKIIQKAHVIYNPVSLREEQKKHSRDSRARIGLTSGETGIACVANLHPYKGHKDLIKAFEIFSQTYSQTKLF